MRPNQNITTAMLVLALGIAAAPDSAGGTGDARSQPDIVAGGCPGQSSAAPVIVRVTAPQTELDWGDVGIGAAATLGVTISALAGAIAISQHRARRNSSPAGAGS
jgi:hypothetical protein